MLWPKQNKQDPETIEDLIDTLERTIVDIQFVDTGPNEELNRTLAAAIAALSNEE